MVAAACVRWVGLAVLGAALGAAHAGAAAATPVEKVIELMKKLSTDLEAEGKEEAAQYDKYACFCKEQADEKNYNIEKSTKTIAKLTAQIGELDADLAELNKEIGTIVKDIAGLNKEVAKLTKARAKEREKYKVDEADLAGAVAALQSAIESLDESKTAMADQDDDAKMNLVQVAHKSGARIMATIDSSTFDIDDRHLEAVQALIEMGETDGQEPPSYEYRSNDILSTLKSLLNSKFLPQKKILDESEFASLAEFEKRTLGLKNEAKFAEKDKAEKEEVVGQKTEEKEAATGDKVQETKDMDADGVFLKELTGDCEEKSVLWDQRSTSRSGEVTAISKALEVLESGAAAQYEANDKLTGLVQARARPVQERGAKVTLRDAPSFMQIHEASAGRARSERLTALLAAAALKLNSQVLSVAAVKVMAEGEGGPDHFVKIRGIIKDLIGTLADQAEAEATQKGFCDTQMARATGARDGAQANIESIAATQTELGSEKDLLMKAVADLSETISMESKALLEATVLRDAESKENQATISTAIEGKAAVQMAMQVLQQYYGKAFLQYTPANGDSEGKTVSDRAPEIFDEKYGGDQQASKGIMGLLEVILSDFDRTVTAVQQEEKEADATFGSFKTETKKGIKSKNASKKAKETRVTTIEDDLIELEGKLGDEKLLLNSAHETLSKLQEKCVQGEETYAERVAKRRQEIEALKSALDIFENWQG